jgi:hypothetical protein
MDHQSCCSESIYVISNMICNALQYITVFRNSNINLDSVEIIKKFCRELDGISKR